jgi:hypothetical protein
LKGHHNNVTKSEAPEKPPPLNEVWPIVGYPPNVWPCTAVDAPRRSTTVLHITKHTHHTYSDT